MTYFNFIFSYDNNINFLSIVKIYVSFLYTILIYPLFE